MEYLKENKKSPLFVLTFSISVILLGISLSQDAYYTGDRQDSVGSSSLIAFLFGWMNIAGPGISWLANPALIISYIQHSRGKLKHALYYSLAALLLCLIFLLFREIIVSEAGHTGEITGYGLGYWLWLSSISINAIGIGFNFKKSMSRNE